MVHETPSTYVEILEQSAAEIRVIRDIVNSAKNVCTSETQRKMVALNASFLVSEGRVSENAYREILGRCVASGDFTELAKTFRQHQRAQTEADLQMPDLPDTGDDFSPGRQNLQAELRMIAAGQEVITQLKGKNPITNIGTPSLAQQPEWLLHCPLGWKLDDIFASVDTIAGATHGDLDIDAITEAAKKKIRNVA